MLKYADFKKYYMTDNTNSPEKLKQMSLDELFTELDNVVNALVNGDPTWELRENYKRVVSEIKERCY